jgi:hypothetical protein
LGACTPETLPGTPWGLGGTLPHFSFPAQSPTEIRQLALTFTNWCHFVRALFRYTNWESANWRHLCRAHSFPGLPAPEGTSRLGGMLPLTGALSKPEARGGHYPSHTGCGCPLSASWNSANWHPSCRARWVGNEVQSPTSMLHSPTGVNRRRRANPPGAGRFLAQAAPRIHAPPPDSRPCRAPDGGVEHTNRAKVGLTLSDS